MKSCLLEKKSPSSTSSLKRGCPSQREGRRAHLLDPRFLPSFSLYRPCPPTSLQARSQPPDSRSDVHAQALHLGLPSPLSLVESRRLSSPSSLSSSSTFSPPSSFPPVAVQALPSQQQDPTLSPYQGTSPTTSTTPSKPTFDQRLERRVHG